MLSQKVSISPLWETLQKKEADNMAGSQLPCLAWNLETGDSTPNEAGLCRASHDLDPTHVASNGLSCFQKSKPPSKDNIIKITSC